MEITGASLFLLGLLGTGHCLGMCGPLIVALPGADGRWHAHLSYHTGRLATYSLVGAVMGAIGAGLGYLSGLNAATAMQWTARIQIGIALVAAIFLFVFGLVRLGLMREPGWMSAMAPTTAAGFGPALRRLANRSAGQRLYLLGMMFGLLPCGLSYAAFARALATGSVASGAWLCLVFGLGTLPGLLVLGTGAAAFWRRYRIHMEMAAGLLMIAMAASLAADALSACF